MRRESPPDETAAAGSGLGTTLLSMVGAEGLASRWAGRAAGRQRAGADLAGFVEDQTEFMVRWTPDGTCTFVNEAYARFLSRPPAELVGTSFFDSIDEEDREPVRAKARGLSQETPCVIVEHRVMLAGGESGWNGWSLRGIFEGADLVEIQAVGRDITERKGAETALRESERRYRSLYTKTPVMLHSSDAAGRLLSVSDHWLRKLGYASEDVIGQPLQHFLTEDSRRQFEMTTLPALAATGCLEDEPVCFRKRNGEIVEALLSAVAERSAEGALKRTLVVSIDVTDRNRAERARQAAFEEIARLKEELERERDYLREEVKISQNFGDIVGESPALRQVLERIEAVAATPSSVLILGESGVGKELVARALYSRSERRKYPLVKVNCASVPHELFESEFFGHVRGAFTGAHRDRVGRFQLADRGTLFLDEVAEIPLDLQSKLLRVLQEGEFERVGEDVTRRVDVRIIAATNRDLRAEVEQGRFREDLYYRLSVFPIEVPPLRRRRDDIIPLARHFLELACRDLGHAKPLALSRFQADALQRYEWPGNVRELRNVLERAVIFSRNGRLRLDLALPAGEAGEAAMEERSGTETPSDDFLTIDQLRTFQKRNLEAALERAGWRVSGAGGAADLMGTKPSTLSYQMKALGVRKPRERRRSVED